MSERKYGNEHTAGEAELVDQKETVEVGSCPACGAMVSTGLVVHPRTQQSQRGLLHPMPFCHYFGATEPEQVVADIRAKAEVS